MSNLSKGMEPSHFTAENVNKLLFGRKSGISKALKCIYPEKLRMFPKV